MNDLAEIYSDYLIASFGLTTATGLSKLLDGEISHDKITRFLASQINTSKDLWQFVNPVIREIKTNNCCLIYLEGLDAPVLLIKQIFTNGDGKMAVQYLISSDTKLSTDDITSN